MAVKTTMSDLHMILMEQMQRLNESEPDELKAEIERSEAMAEQGNSGEEEEIRWMRTMSGSGAADSARNTGRRAAAWSRGTR